MTVAVRPKTVIPTISEEGWVTDSKRKLDYILSYYVLTDYSQSYIFDSSIISLPKTYYLHINEPDDFAAAIRNDLETILNRYFESSEIECDVRQIGNTKGYMILLRVACIDHEGVRVELSKVTELINSKSRRIIHTSNYGDARSVFLG